MTTRAEDHRKYDQTRDRLHIHEAARAKAKDADERAKIERLSYARDLQEVMDMASGAGLRVLRRILDRGGLLGQPFDDNPNRAAYQAGQLEVARALWLDMVAVDPPTAQRALAVMAEDRAKGAETA